MVDALKNTIACTSVHRVLRHPSATTQHIVNELEMGVCMANSGYPMGCAFRLHGPDEPPFVIFVAERRRGDFADPSNVRTCRQPRADIGCLRRSHSTYREIRNASDASGNRACASQVLEALPNRLRRPSLKNRSTATVRPTQVRAVVSLGRYPRWRRADTEQVEH